MGDIRPLVDCARVSVAQCDDLAGLLWLRFCLKTYSAKIIFRFWQSVSLSSSLSTVYRCSCLEQSLWTFHLLLLSLLRNLRGCLSFLLKKPISFAAHPIAEFVQCPRSNRPTKSWFKKPRFSGNWSPEKISNVQICGFKTVFFVVYNTHRIEFDIIGLIVICEWLTALSFNYLAKKKRRDMEM